MTGSSDVRAPYAQLAPSARRRELTNRYRERLDTRLKRVERELGNVEDLKTLLRYHRPRTRKWYDKLRSIGWFRKAERVTRYGNARETEDWEDAIRSTLSSLLNVVATIEVLCELRVLDHASFNKLAPLVAKWVCRDEVRTYYEVNYPVPVVSAYRLRLEGRPLTVVEVPTAEKKEGEEEKEEPFQAIAEEFLWLQATYSASEELSELKDALDGFILRTMRSGREVTFHIDDFDRMVRRVMEEWLTRIRAGEADGVTEHLEEPFKSVFLGLPQLIDHAESVRSLIEDSEMVASLPPQARLDVQAIVASYFGYYHQLLEKQEGRWGPAWRDLRRLAVMAQFAWKLRRVPFIGRLLERMLCSRWLYMYPARAWSMLRVAIGLGAERSRTEGFIHDRRGHRQRFRDYVARAEVVERQAG